MINDANEKDLLLLKEEPHLLILSYQTLIDIIIKQYMSNGSFNYHEYYDIKQQVNEILINRIPKIQAQFQGKSLLKTYFTVIIRNICKELIRKHKDLQLTTKDFYCIENATDDIINPILIKEEVNKLKVAINLYFKQKAKLILCLRLKYRMPFDFSDFIDAYPQMTIRDFDFFTQKIHSYQDNPDIVIFSIFNDIVNRFEAKNNTPDALRKWIKLKINELIDILNGNPPLSKYDEETLQILFEKAYFKKEGILNSVY
jgi:RNA polymerase sigma factor (sigma-70 family)